jgi:hypothetical protein
MGGGRGWGDADLITSRPVTDQSLAGMAKTLDLVPALRGMRFDCTNQNA